VRERYRLFAERRPSRYVGDKLGQCRYYGKNVLKSGDVRHGFKHPVIERMALGGFTCLKFNEGKVAQNSWIIWSDCQAPLVDRPANDAGLASASCFFQLWIIVGWTSNRLANSETVWSPRRAARATLALNAAPCFLRDYFMSYSLNLCHFRSLNVA